MIRIIGIYRPREEPWQSLQSEYLKRMRPYCRIECVAVKADTSNETSVRARKESEALFEIVKPHARIVLLDAEGKRYDSLAFAAHARGWFESGEDTVIIIGGAFGIALAWKKQAHEVISLSPLTLPHDLARIVLLEQLYRSVTLWKGIPYHY